MFRKREAGIDRPVSFGVVPGVLAEAEMTINIPSPKNFCLYEVPLDRLEVGKFQFFLIKSIPSVSSTWAREDLSRFFCFYSLKRILWIKERERRQELVCWRGCAFHHVPHSLISVGFQHPWTFGHPSMHPSIHPPYLMNINQMPCAKPLALQQRARQTSSCFLFNGPWCGASTWRGMDAPCKSWLLLPKVIENWRIVCLCFSDVVFLH